MLVAMLLITGQVLAKHFVRVDCRSPAGEVSQYTAFRVGTCYQTQYAAQDGVSSVRVDEEEGGCAVHHFADAACSKQVSVARVVLDKDNYIGDPPPFVVAASPADVRPSPVKTRYTGACCSLDAERSLDVLVYFGNAVIHQYPNAYCEDEGTAIRVPCNQTRDGMLYECVKEGCPVKPQPVSDESDDSRPPVAPKGPSNNGHEGVGVVTAVCSVLLSVVLTFFV